MELSAWHALVRGEGIIWFILLALLALAWGYPLLRRALEDIRLKGERASRPSEPRK